ncbi:hypothetical protein PR003_g17811 [Phytophthora rubi]|uniref:Uncharacterized protein n=1 Tax=Phytophthora rubi TaxID=129364 RepID=A0A6A4ECE0_9STRA|nr:hypothetical protein PR003_g17811 [Phytophthora rubi]
MVLWMVRLSKEVFAPATVELSCRRSVRMSSSGLSGLHGLQQRWVLTSADTEDVDVDLS